VSPSRIQAAAAVLGLLAGAGDIIATVALYQGRIEERVANVDRRLERIEAKLDTIAPPTVRVGEAPTGTTRVARED